MNTRILLLISLGFTLPALGELLDKQPVQATATARFDLSPGGLIRVTGSSGSLQVQGWDRPEVEITVTKSTLQYYDAQHKETGTKVLESARVATERRSPTELEITTTRSLHRRFPWLEDEVSLEYVIHAPRESRLEIHHRDGSVLIESITGDVEASGHRGDIVLMLSGPGQYSIDAKTTIGTVSSDPAGAPRVRRLVGERLVGENPAPAHRIFVRMGLGGITIKEVPPEAAGPVSSPVPGRAAP